jgi:hypothetical protein
MNSSIKGACLSGLVFPGLGQIAQRHYMRGIVLISIVSACLIMILVDASRKINTILANINSSNTGLDITSILKEIHTSSAGGDILTMNTLSALIFGCWVIGIVDSYLSGKMIDSQNAAHNKSP